MSFFSKGNTVIGFSEGKKKITSLDVKGAFGLRRSWDFGVHSDLLKII